jgi:transcriptional regulator with XRE-family HTH domain
VEQGAELEDTARRRLRTLRQARGWTLDDLAARAHVGASTISRIETGQRRLALDQLVTLARALGVSVDDLLADDGAGDDVVIRPSPSADGGAVWLAHAHPGRAVPSPASGPAEILTIFDHHGERAHLPAR